MLDLLHDWLGAVPIVHLFVIIAAGHLLGEVRFPGGFRLGVAGVLLSRCRLLASAS